jgi:hypothetical protein
MGQETENDRDWWKCRFWHGIGNRKRFSVSSPMPKPTFPSVSVVFFFLSHAKTYISISLCRFLFPIPCQSLHFHQSLSFSVSCSMPKPTFPSVLGQETENDRDWWKCRFWHGTGNRKRQRLRFLFPVPCQSLHFHQSLSFSVSYSMPKPACPSVSVVFCFLSHAKTYISISLCRFLENDRDWWKCRLWHGTGNRKRQRLMEM